MTFTTAGGKTGAPAAVWCTELELGDPQPVSLVAPIAEQGGEARVLLRFHGEPLEFVQQSMTDGEVSRAALLSGLTAAGRTRLADHLAVDAAEVERTSNDDAVGNESLLPDGAVLCRHPIGTGLRVSVVVCTRDRGPALRDCLVELKALQYSDLEIIIVDNAPTNDDTLQAFMAEVGADDRFRYVLEPRPGLSCARNRGLAEATGEIIAYTDDDVRVDPAWVGALVNGFRRRTDVACVTSLVCTASLQTPAEHYFDARVSWAGSCEPQLYDRVAPDGDVLYPYSPGLFGTGAGMAFRTAVIRELGGFDEALGAGTRTAGGEDLDAFVRILQAGYVLAYEPSSMVWHHHRSDLDGLQRQMYSYGTGLTAFLTKHLLDRTTRSSLLRRVPRGVAKLASVPKTTRTAVGAVEVPSRSLLVREFAGMAAGPALYGIARKKIPAPAAHSRLANATEVAVR